MCSWKSGYVVYNLETGHDGAQDKGILTADKAQKDAFNKRLKHAKIKKVEQKVKEF